MEALGMVLGVVGLIATLASLYFAYIVYANPLVRLKWYLKDVKNWPLLASRFNESFEYWHYSKHPEFTIELKDDGKWEGEEPWMKRVPRPDPSLFRYEVALKINGVVVYSEKFLAMDGWRYFVPIPKVELTEGKNADSNAYYYDQMQTLIAGVIGKYHHDKDLSEFSGHAGIQLQK